MTTSLGGPGGLGTTWQSQARNPQSVNIQCTCCRFHTDFFLLHPTPPSAHIECAADWLGVAIVSQEVCALQSWSCVVRARPWLGNSNATSTQARRTAPLRTCQICRQLQFWGSRFLHIGMRNTTMLHRIFAGMCLHMCHLFRYMRGCLALPPSCTNCLFIPTQFAQHGFGKEGGYLYTKLRFKQLCIFPRILVPQDLSGRRCTCLPLHPSSTHHDVQRTLPLHCIGCTKQIWRTTTWTAPIFVGVPAT